MAKTKSKGGSSSSNRQRSASLNSSRKRSASSASRTRSATTGSIKRGSKTNSLRVTSASSSSRLTRRKATQDKSNSKLSVSTPGIKSLRKPASQTKPSSNKSPAEKRKGIQITRRERGPDDSALSLSFPGIQKLRKPAAPSTKPSTETENEKGNGIRVTRRERGPNDPALSISFPGIQKLRKQKQEQSSENDSLKTATPSTQDQQTDSQVEQDQNNDSSKPNSDKYRSLISQIAVKEQAIKSAKSESEKSRLQKELDQLKNQKAEISKKLSDQWHKENLGESNFDEKLVLQQFSYNWFSMKDQLAYTDGDTENDDYIKQLAAMERMLEFRQKEVDQLLDQAKTEIEKETGETVSPIAVGSVSPTSDYDITFEMEGRPDLEHLAVRRFNALFLKKFGVPSGVMFDTNVYTTGFMPSDGSQVKGLEYKDKMMENSSERNLDAVRKGKIEKYFTQLSLSLLPIRQHLQDDKQWGDFLVGVREEMRFHILPHIDQADRQKVESVIDSGLSRLFLQIENLDQETKFQLQKEKDRIKREQQLPPEVSQNKAALEMHVEALAKDRLYEKTLLRVADRLKDLKTNADQLDKETNKTKRKELLAKRAILITNFEKEQGKALVYANEAYFSGGAAVHVVKGLQSGGDFNLGKQQKMQSLLMNIGYKLQHFSHQQKEHGVERAIIGTSKYGQRVNNLVSRSASNEVALKGLISLPARRLLDDEDLAITNFKKNDRDLPTPTDKEINATQLMQGKSEQQYVKEVEDSFLEIARNALGPYFLTKYREQKKRDPENLGKFDTFWS